MDTIKTMSYLSQSLYKKRLFAAFLAALFLLALSNAPVAEASRSGIERRNNSFTVGMTFKNSGVDEVCSGALLSPTFILTAAHCIINELGEYNTNFVFTAPGKSLEDPINTATMPKILKTYLPSTYVNSNRQYGDDIAFIKLDKPLATKGFVRIATANEVANLIDGEALSGFGYGAVYETGATYSNYPREYPLYWTLTADVTTLKTNQIVGYSSVACAGDSGGPIIHEISPGVLVLIGNMSGAASVSNRCGTKAADGNFYMHMTVAYHYLSLVQSELTKSLAVPTSTSKPTVKIYKITCVKGSLKKTLSGSNPKCPTGFKQTAKVLITR